MKKTRKSTLALVLLMAVSLSGTAQEAAKEKSGGHKMKEEVAQMYSLVEYSDYGSLNPGQKKHLELYRRQKQMRLAGNYDPKKCFEPIYTPMAEFAEQLRPLALNATSKAQQTYEKLVSEKKEQMAKRMQVQYNAYANLAKYCEKIEKAFKEHKTGELEEGITLLQRQMVMMKKEGLKVPNREWLTQKEADVIMAKNARQKKAMQGLPQGNPKQHPGVRPQPKVRQ